MNPELIQTSREDLAFVMVVTFFVGMVATMLLAEAISCFCHIRAWIKGRSTRKQLALIKRDLLFESFKAKV